MLCFNSFGEVYSHFLLVLQTVALIVEVRLQRVVPSFNSTQFLQAPKGHYVELNFTLKTSYPTPCTTRKGLKHSTLIKDIDPLFRDLQDNQIEELPPGVFDNNTDLVTL